MGQHFLLFKRNKSVVMSRGVGPIMEPAVTRHHQLKFNAPKIGSDDLFEPAVMGRWSSNKPFCLALVLIYSHMSAASNTVTSYALSSQLLLNLGHVWLRNSSGWSGSILCLVCGHRNQALPTSNIRSISRMDSFRTKNIGRAHPDPTRFSPYRALLALPPSTGLDGQGPLPLTEARAFGR